MTSTYLDRFGTPIPKEELTAQRYRLELLDTLSPKCKWKEWAPGWEAMEYRIRFKRIMEECAEFEERYI